MKASTGSKVLKALQLNYRRPKENGAKCDGEKELKTFPRRWRRLKTVCIDKVKTEREGDSESTSGRQQEKAMRRRKQMDVKQVRECCCRHDRLTALTSSRQEATPQLRNGR